MKNKREKLTLKVKNSISSLGMDNHIFMEKKNFCIDTVYLRALSNTLTEWNAAEDEKNYEHLQNLSNDS